MVSYFFPPAGSVGVHRTLRFIKSLPAFGWNPVVLTASNAKVGNLEPSLLDKVAADVEVCRSRSFEALNYGKLIDGVQSKPLPSIVSKLCVGVPRDVWKYVAIPDEKLSWNPFAIRAGAKILKEQKIDAIYVTGKPFSSYFIGHSLSQRFGIPWIMDLRDLWVLNRRMRPKTSVHERLEAWMERRFVRSASVVVVNTPGNQRDFAERYPELPAEKFVTITNGFDRDDFAGDNPPKYDRFTIGYSGAFYFQRPEYRTFYRRLFGLQRKRLNIYETYSPKFLFEAVTLLFQERPELRDRVQFVFSGPGCQKIECLVDEYGLQRNVKLLGWVTYQESLELLRRSHVLCVTLSRGEESEGWIPSKLYQYMGAGNPILGLVPNGDVRNIIEETETGVAVPPDDVQQIKTAISRMYADYENRLAFQPKSGSVENYEGRFLTAKLVDCLERAVGV